MSTPIATGATASMHCLLTLILFPSLRRKWDYVSPANTNPLSLMCTNPLSPSLCRRWDRKYWTTYKVLDILQKVFYRSNPAREAFVELCEDSYVQKMTFDSYLYKTVVPGNPMDDFKLLVRTVSSMLRSNALRTGPGLSVSFGSKSNEEKLQTAQ